MLGALRRRGDDEAIGSLQRGLSAGNDERLGGGDGGGGFVRQQPSEQDSSNGKGREELHSRARAHAQAHAGALGGDDVRSRAEARVRKRAL